MNQNSQGSEAAIEIGCTIQTTNSKLSLWLWISCSLHNIVLFNNQEQKLYTASIGFTLTGERSKPESRDLPQLENEAGECELIASHICLVELRSILYSNTWDSATCTTNCSPGSKHVHNQLIARQHYSSPTFRESHNNPESNTHVCQINNTCI